jgi:hypothetical protein
MGVSEPVLVIAFNRPDLLAVLLQRLREVEPSRLFIAVDGPRQERAGEAERVQACRELAETVDWDCEVRTLFQESNLGCGRGVSTAISWFFENVERGIILEDDIIPDPSFFGFCSELLDRYEDDDRVFAVSGCNYVPAEGLSDPGAPYRFSRVPHIWGWAGWRRTWEGYRLDISDWRDRLPTGRLWESAGRSLPGMVFWAGMFRTLGRGEIDTWDGQLVLSAMEGGRLTATSNVNLVENVGFGTGATHTVEGMDVQPVAAIALPTSRMPVRLDERADAWTRRHHFHATATGVPAMMVKYLRQRLNRRRP